MTFYKDWFEKNEEQIWKDFFAYLSIPSISADPAYKNQQLKAASFIEGRLKKLGMNVSRWEDLSSPVFFAERIVDESYPTVLIYGHYDVQPPDPLDLWDSPPFEPQERDGKIFARGAEDNKGQNFYTLLAVEAFYAKHSNPKVNVKFIIEGEEEIGSPGFEKLAEKYKSRLKADSIWMVDNGIESYKHPVLSLGVRGVASLEVTVSNASFDLHSGCYGGAVYNPIQALSEMLASVYDKKGHIAIDGFYDGVKQLTSQEKSELALDTPRAVFEKDTGATCFRKEEGYTLQECISIRPTFEVNGMYGGYTGEGGKTIIPSTATAKITCRTVGGQDATKVGEKVIEHFHKVAPEGIQVSIDFHGGGASAWTSPSSYTAKVFRDIVSEVLGTECKFGYAGGSIPLTEILAGAADAEYIFLGTGLPSDRIHSPNENFSKKQFVDGYSIITKGLEKFAENDHGW